MDDYGYNVVLDDVALWEDGDCDHQTLGWVCNAYRVHHHQPCVGSIFHILSQWFFFPLMAMQVVVGLRMGSKEFGSSLVGLLRGVNFKWEIICLGETHGTWWVLMEECTCLDIVRSLAVCNVGAVVLRS